MTKRKDGAPPDPAAAERRRVARQKQRDAPAGQRWCSWGQHYAPEANFMVYKRSAKQPGAVRFASYCEAHEKEYGRDYHLRTTFGVSATEYDALLKAQGGVCAICGKPSNPSTRRKRGSRQPVTETKRLAVDHDHKTGAVRGLLCYNCNHRLLGTCSDPVILRAAADYLEGYQAAGPSGPYPVDVPPSNATPPSVAQITPPPS